MTMEESADAGTQSGIGGLGLTLDVRFCDGGSTAVGGDFEVRWSGAAFAIE